MVENPARHWYEPAGQHNAGAERCRTIVNADGWILAIQRMVIKRRLGFKVVVRLGDLNNVVWQRS